MNVKPIHNFSDGKKSVFKGAPKFTNHPQIPALQNIIRKLQSDNDLDSSDQKLLKQNQIFIGIRNNRDLIEKINQKITELNAPPRNQFDNPRQKALHEARESLGL